MKRLQRKHDTNTMSHAQLRSNICVKLKMIRDSKPNDIELNKEKAIFGEKRKFRRAACKKKDLSNQFLKKKKDSSEKWSAFCTTVIYIMRILYRYFTTSRQIDKKKQVTKSSTCYSLQRSACDSDTKRQIKS